MSFFGGPDVKLPALYLQTTLSLGILLVHDPLLLRSLLLLTASLGGLLALSMGLLQEVLLHAGAVSVGFLLALKWTERIKWTRGRCGSDFNQSETSWLSSGHSPLC